MSDWLSSLTSLVPTQLKSVAGDSRDRLAELSADISFRRQSLPDCVPRPDAPDHVVLLVVDALRDDFVSRRLTSTLSDIHSTDAVAPAPWTFPSVSSILTGLYPHEHGAVRQRDDGHTADDDQMTVPPTLDDSVVTLPECLAAAGYRTFGGFAFQVPFLSVSGHFHTHRRHWDARAPTVFDQYLDWVRGRNRTFGYLHIGDIHEPIDLPKLYLRRHGVDTDIDDISRWDYLTPEDSDDAKRYRRHRRRLYRAAVDYVDDCIDEFMQRLDDTVGDDPVVIVTSDHGEAMWEHTEFDAERFHSPRGVYGVGHGATPYEAVTRVPLCVRGLSVTDGPASLIDITPTLLDRLCSSYPSGMSGESLGDSRDSDRVLLTESARYGSEKRAVYTDNWKLLISESDDVAVGFELPDETQTVLPTDVEQQLRSAVPPWPDGRDTRVVDGAVRDRLEDLGYQ